MVVVVQSLSHVQLFTTAWTEACQASLSFTISWSVQILVHSVSDACYNNYFYILYLCLFVD